MAQPEILRVALYIDRYREIRDLLIKPLPQVDDLSLQEWRLFTKGSRQIIWNTLGKGLTEPEESPSPEDMHEAIFTVLESSIQLVNDQKVSNKLLSVLLECEASILSEEGKHPLALKVHNLSKQIAEIARPRRPQFDHLEGGLV